MSRPTYCEIDILALQHNLERIKTLAPAAKILAMIKANAYGHGLKEAALALSKADAFGVACVEEAISLRQAGVKNAIVLMAGFFSTDELDLIIKHDLQIVVHNNAQLEILSQFVLKKPLIVWLKIDTGMHRLGFSVSEVKDAYACLSNNKNIQEIRLLSHLSEPENLNQPTTQQQIECFETHVKTLQGSRSLAKSAAILAWPQTYYDWIRPGIMLYGVSPFMEKTGSDHGLKPVMTLHSKIIATHELAAGDRIGYGGKWTCPEKMPVGIIAIGYGDGYPRHAVNGTPVLVNEKIVPLVGCVSMDMIAVDLRTQPNAKIGDPVVLWGKGLPVEVIAKHSSTIPYELLCCVTERVRKKE